MPRVKTVEGKELGWLDAVPCVGSEIVFGNAEEVYRVTRQIWRLGTDKQIGRCITVVVKRWQPKGKGAPRA